MGEFAKKAADKTNSAVIALIGILSAIFLWATIVALQAYYKNTNSDVLVMREAEGQSAGVRRLKAEQKAELRSTTFSDATKGKLKRLPIERAKYLVVEAASKGQGSLVPSIGAHNEPTIPAQFGKPGVVADPKTGAQDAGGQAAPAAADPADAQSANEKKAKDDGAGAASKAGRESDSAKKTGSNASKAGAKTSAKEKAAEGKAAAKDAKGTKPAGTPKAEAPEGSKNESAKAAEEKAEPKQDTP